MLSIKTYKNNNNNKCFWLQENLIFTKKYQPFKIFFKNINCINLHNRDILRYYRYDRLLYYMMQFCKISVTMCCVLFIGVCMNVCKCIEFVQVQMCSVVCVWCSCFSFSFHIIISTSVTVDRHCDMVYISFNVLCAIMHN